MKEIILPPDEALIRRLRNGDERSFELVYRHFASDLIDFASRKLGSLSEAKDIVHDLFVSLWAKREKLDINVSLNAYLFIAIRYKLIDHIRKNVRYDFYAKLVRSMNSDDDNATFDGIIYKDLSHVIDSEIGKLPCRTRRVFLLSKKHEMSISEIAGIMEVSEQTAKNQLTTASKKLRPVLSKLMLVIPRFRFSKF